MSKTRPRLLRQQKILGILELKAPTMTDDLAEDKIEAKILRTKPPETMETIRLVKSIFTARGW